MGVNPLRSLIGMEGVVNRGDSRWTGDDGAGRDAAKVAMGRADEVWERGAFRRVNRISQVLLKQL